MPAALVDQWIESFGVLSAKTGVFLLDFYTQSKRILGLWMFLDFFKALCKEQTLYTAAHFRAKIHVVLGFNFYVHKQTWE